MMKKGLKNNCHSELVSGSLNYEMLKQVQHDKTRRVQFFAPKRFFGRSSWFVINRKINAHPLNDGNIAAFTLAEVLITLTIIGVIAVLTIPNLMKKWEDQHTVSAVKEAYSIFDNAIKMAVKENGFDLSELKYPAKGSKVSDTQARADYLAEQLLPYLKVKEYCGGKLHSPSCITGTIKNMRGGNASTAGLPTNLYCYGGQMVLQNGMGIAFDVFLPTSGKNSNLSQSYYASCADLVGGIFVDINNKKGPNKFGTDAFLIPFSVNGTGVPVECTRRFNRSINKNDCKLSNINATGASCSTWIFLHSNTDYKYRDVSAEW